MMQIEVRINGVLIEFVDAINTGLLAPGPDDDCIVYSVRWKGREFSVLHRPEDGAMKLAALALEGAGRNMK
ncbi:MAG: hypothetical protein GY832_11505 [Chloroflexi bacterium]|nr:hypothetical protein [Chloroflexota bacterium]